MSHGVSIMDLKYQQEKSWDVEPVFGHLQNDRYGRNAEMWKKRNFATLIEIITKEQNSALSTCIYRWKELTIIVEYCLFVI